MSPGASRPAVTGANAAREGPAWPGHAKIDTEGHELAVLRGMTDLLRRDRPQLIVEDNDSDVEVYLSKLGHSSEKAPGSSDKVFRPAGVESQPTA